MCIYMNFIDLCGAYLNTISWYDLFSVTVPNCHWSPEAGAHVTS